MLRKLFIKIWEYFWEKSADYHFYKWIKTKNEKEMNHYLCSIGNKFFRFWGE